MSAPAHPCTKLIGHIVNRTSDASTLAIGENTMAEDGEAQ
jgi:hypothetical protein